MKTRDELLNEITAIGTVADEAERRVKLTALSDEVKSLYDSHDTLSASNKKFEEDNKKLQEYNMELFLRVGDQKETKKEPETKTEDLSYEKLFNEKGELI